MKKIIRILIPVFVVSLFFTAPQAGAQAQAQLTKEIVITVENNIIAMPGNNVKEAPIGSARVRSTELRDLNKQYNAIKIAKVFKTIKVGKEPPRDVLVDDTYVITFVPDTGVNMQNLVSDYLSLSVILSAREKL